MSERTGHGHPVRSWQGDARGWPHAPLEQGPIRISGTVLDDGASWHVTTDRLGWSTITLLADTAFPADVPDVTETLHLAASETADPMATARMLRDTLGARAESIGLAIARVGRFGQLVELLNVSLPSVLFWDPVEGLLPFEPMVPSLAELPPRGTSEVMRLNAGGALALTTCGLLPIDADWEELRHFVRALGLDPIGGAIAEAHPQELTRVLQASWRRMLGPAGVVVIGVPPVSQMVA
jgi:hypothetical protein